MRPLFALVRAVGMLAAGLLLSAPSAEAAFFPGLGMSTQPVVFPAQYGPYRQYSPYRQYGPYRQYSPYEPYRPGMGMARPSRPSSRFARPYVPASHECSPCEGGIQRCVRTDHSGRRSAYTRRCR
jgi:hypothetical protein